MANEEHVALLKSSLFFEEAPEWNAWRQQNPDIRPDLVEARLGEEDLAHADLHQAHMRGAVLTAAGLRYPDFASADLRDASLGDANLGSATLVDADLSGADLSGANLLGASLRGARLRGASLGYPTSVARTSRGPISLKPISRLPTPSRPSLQTPTSLDAASTAYRRGDSNWTGPRSKIWSSRLKASLKSPSTTSRWRSSYTSCSTIRKSAPRSTPSPARRCSSLAASHKSAKPSSTPCGMSCASATICRSCSTLMFQPHGTSPRPLRCWPACLASSLPI